jgi:acetylornithine deacetylase
MKAESEISWKSGVALSGPETRSLLVEMLPRMISIPSVFPNEEKFGDYMNALLKEAGFSTKVFSLQGSRPNIVATSGIGPPYFGFYGHLDTVEPAIDYEQNPYEMILDGDIARGLGVADMKGGVCAMFIAARELAKRGVPIKFILGSDEENISLGAHHLCDNQALDDVGTLIVAEMGMPIVEGQKYQFSLGRKGRASITVDITGRKSHAAQANKGVNSIVEGVRFLSRLLAIELPSHARLGVPSFVPQFFHSETKSFSLPEITTIRLSALSTPDMSNSMMLGVVRDLLAELRIDGEAYFTPRETPYGESYEVNVKDPFVSSVLQGMVQRDGISPKYASSVADENIFAYRCGLPVITLGPTGGGEHTAREWVSLSSLVACVDRYVEMGLAWMLNKAGDCSGIFPISSSSD